MCIVSLWESESASVATPAPGDNNFSYLFPQILFNIPHLIFIFLFVQL